MKCKQHRRRLFLPYLSSLKPVCVGGGYDSFIIYFSLSAKDLKTCPFRELLVAQQQQQQQQQQ